MSSSKSDIQQHLTVSTVPNSTGQADHTDSKPLVLPTARSHIKASDEAAPVGDRVREERVVVLPSTGSGVETVATEVSEIGEVKERRSLDAVGIGPDSDVWSAPEVATPSSGVGTTEGEEKNIFSSLNAETLFRLEEVLSGTNEGQQILKEGLGGTTATGKDIMDDSALSLKIDESADLDFVLDESMITESLNAGNLTAIASAFAADHAYASTPGRNTPGSVNMDNNDTDNEDHLSRSIDSESRINSESELNTSRDERDDQPMGDQTGDDQQTGEDSQEDSGRSRRGRRRRGGHTGSRRSTRVQEISQRQEAEKIMAENLEKERAALENLQKLKPGEKIPVVKSYNMRVGRSRRDDGRIDYTKLAKGQGRVLVTGEGVEDSGGEGSNPSESVVGGEADVGEGSVQEQESLPGEDSLDEDSSLMSSPAKTDDTSTLNLGFMSSPAKTAPQMKRVLSKIRTDSDDTSTLNDSLDSTELTEVKSRGRGRGRGRGLGRGRGRARGRGVQAKGVTPRSDEEGSPNEARMSIRGSRSRGPRVRSRGRGGRTRGRGTRQPTDSALTPSDSDDQSPVSSKSLSKQQKQPNERESEPDSSAEEQKSGLSSESEDESLKEVARKLKEGKVQSTADQGGDDGDSSDDLPLTKLQVNKSPAKTLLKKKMSKYEQDSDYTVTPHSSEEELEYENSVKDLPEDEEVVKVESDATKTTAITDSSVLDEDPESSELSADYNDPKKKWCICKKPWHNRFMICCDKCQDWFHGSCVGVSTKSGKRTKHWICPRCIKEETSTKTKKKVPKETPPKRPIPPTRQKLTNEKRDLKIVIKGLDRQRLENDGQSYSQEGERQSNTDNRKPDHDSEKVSESSQRLGEDSRVVDAGKYSQESESEASLMIAETSAELSGLESDETRTKTQEDRPKQEVHSQQEMLPTKQEVKQKQEVKSLKKDIVKVKKKTKPHSIEAEIEDIFGSTDEEPDDAKDTDFVKEPADTVEPVSGGSREVYGSKSNTENIVKKAEKNKDKVKDLKKQLESVKAKREKKELRHKEKEIIEMEKRKEVERVERAKKEVERREKERAKENEYVPSKERCIAPGCKKRKGADSVYCSERCIHSHADQSLDMLREERDKMFGFKSQGSGSERIVVLERVSGRILTGPAAPTESSLKSWLVKHPSYEVLQPGQNPGGSSAAKKKESKEKEEKRREMQLIKEKREKREREASERKAKELAERQERERQDRERHDRERQDRDRERERWERSRSDPSTHSGPDPLRINVRKALRDALDKRANESDDIMLSSGEIKKVALDIEGELFNYYKDTRNNKYRNKYRTILYYIKDPKNQGFFRRILNGLLKPYKLVRLSAEQIGLPEYAKWSDLPTSDKEDPSSQHQIQLPELAFEKFDPPIKPRGNSGKTGSTKATPGDKPGYNQPKQHYESAADIFSSIIVDTTAGHSKHLFDVNCKICTGRQTDVTTPKKEEPPPKKQKTMETDAPLKVETGSYSGFGPKYYESSPTSPNSPAYPTVKSEHANSKHDLFGGESSSGFTGFYEHSKPDREEAPVTVKQEPGTKAPTPQGSDSHGGTPKGTEGGDPRKKGGRDPRVDSSRDPRRRGKKDSHTAPVATGPLVDKRVASPGGLPEGYIWKGHLFVQDMCNLKCMAMPVSGPTDTLKEDMPDTISVVGRLSPPQIWDYLGRLKNSSSRVIVVVSFQPLMEDTLAYYGLFEYLRGKDRCGLLAQFSQKIKDFYLIPLPSESPVPDALMPFNGPGLWVNRPNMLLGVMVMLVAKRPREVQSKEQKAMTTEDTKEKAAVEDTKPSQKDATHFFYGERKDSLTDMDLHVPSATKKPKSEKPHREHKKKSVKTPEINTTPPGVTEEEVKVKVKSETPEVTEATAQTTKSVLDKLTQIKKPGASKEEMAAAVVASLAASTQSKSLDEQKRLLAELTAKVEEQKRYLEQQREKTIRESQGVKVKDEVGDIDAVIDIPLPGAQPATHGAPTALKPTGLPQTSTDTRVADNTKPDSASDNSDDDIITPPKFYIPEREDKPSVLGDNKASYDPSLDTSAFNIARQRLIKKTGISAEDLVKATVSTEGPTGVPPVGIIPVGVPPVTTVATSVAPVTIVTTATIPVPAAVTSSFSAETIATAVTPVTDPALPAAANLAVLPESVQKLLSGTSLENLKNIVAKATSKDSSEKDVQRLPAESRVKSSSGATSGDKKGGFDKEEGEIDDDEIDNELESALGGNLEDDSDLQIIGESSERKADSSPDSQDSRRGRRRRKRKKHHSRDSEDRRERRSIQSEMGSRREINKGRHRRDRRRSRSHERRSRRHRSRDRSREGRGGRNRSRDRDKRTRDSEERRYENSRKRPSDSGAVVANDDNSSNKPEEGDHSAEKRTRRSRFDEPMINTTGDVDYRVEARMRQRHMQQGIVGNNHPPAAQPHSMGGMSRQSPVDRQFNVEDDRLAERQSNESRTEKNDQESRKTSAPPPTSEGEPPGPNWPMAPMSDEDFKNWEKAQMALRLINTHKQQQHREQFSQPDDGEDMVISDQGDPPDDPQSHPPTAPPPPPPPEGMLMFPFNRPPPPIDMHGMRGLPPPMFPPGPRGMMLPPRMLRPMFPPPMMGGRGPPPPPAPPRPGLEFGPREPWVEMRFRPPFGPPGPPPGPQTDERVQDIPVPATSERRVLLPTPDLPRLPRPGDPTESDRVEDTKPQPTTSQGGQSLLGPVPSEGQPQVSRPTTDHKIPSLFDLDIKPPPTSKPKEEMPASAIIPDRPSDKHQRKRSETVYDKTGHKKGDKRDPGDKNGDKKDTGDKRGDKRDTGDKNGDKKGDKRSDSSYQRDSNKNERNWRSEGHRSSRSPSRGRDGHKNIVGDNKGKGRSDERHSKIVSKGSETGSTDSKTGIRTTASSTKTSSTVSTLTSVGTKTVVTASSTAASATGISDMPQTIMTSSINKTITVCGRTIRLMKPKNTADDTSTQTSSTDNNTHGTTSTDNSTQGTSSTDKSTPSTTSSEVLSNSSLHKQKSNATSKKREKGKGSVVFTKEEELSTTPGVLGPLLNFIRGDGPKSDPQKQDQGQSEQVTASDTSSSQPVTTGSKRVTTSSKPVATGSKPDTTSSKPVTSSSQQVTTDSKPVTTSSKPVTNNSEPVTKGSKPVTSNSQPVTTGSKPVTSNSQPVTTGSKPVTSNSQPVTTGSDTVTSNPEPVTTSSVPVTASSGPVIDKNKTKSPVKPGDKPNIGLPAKIQFKLAETENKPVDGGSQVQVTGKPSGWSPAINLARKTQNLGETSVGTNQANILSDKATGDQTSPVVMSESNKPNEDTKNVHKTTDVSSNKKTANQKADNKTQTVNTSKPSVDNSSTTKKPSVDNSSATKLSVDNSSATKPSVDNSSSTKPSGNKTSTSVGKLKSLGEPSSSVLSEKDMADIEKDLATRKTSSVTSTRSSEEERSRDRRTKGRQERSNRRSRSRERSRRSKSRDRRRSRSRERRRSRSSDRTRGSRRRFQGGRSSSPNDSWRNRSDRHSDDGRNRRQPNERRHRFERQTDDSRNRSERQTDDIRSRFERQTDDIRNRSDTDRQTDDSKSRFERRTDDPRSRFERQTDDLKSRFERQIDDSKSRFERQIDDSENRFERQTDDAQRERFNERVSQFLSYQDDDIDNQNKEESGQRMEHSEHHQIRHDPSMNILTENEPNANRPSSLLGGRPEEFEMKRLPLLSHPEDRGSPFSMDRPDRDRPESMFRIDRPDRPESASSSVTSRQSADHVMRRIPEDQDGFFVRRDHHTRPPTTDQTHEGFDRPAPSNFPPQERLVDPTPFFDLARHSRAPPPHMAERNQSLHADTVELRGPERPTLLGEEPRKTLLIRGSREDAMTGRDLLLHRFREGQETSGSGSPFDDQGRSSGSEQTSDQSYGRLPREMAPLFPNMPPQTDDARGMPPPPIPRSGLLGDRPLPSLPCNEDQGLAIEREEEDRREMDPRFRREQHLRQRPHPDFRRLDHGTEIPEDRYDEERNNMDNLVHEDRATRPLPLPPRDEPRNYESRHNRHRFVDELPGNGRPGILGEPPPELPLIQTGDSEDRPEHILRVDHEHGISRYEEPLSRQSRPGYERYDRDPHRERYETDPRRQEYESDQQGYDDREIDIRSLPEDHPARRGFEEQNIPRSLLDPEDVARFRERRVHRHIGDEGETDVRFPHDDRPRTLLIRGEDDHQGARSQPLLERPLLERPSQEFLANRGRLPLLEGRQDLSPPPQHPPPDNDPDRPLLPPPLPPHGMRLRMPLRGPPPPGAMHRGPPPSGLRMGFRPRHFMQGPPPQ